MRTGQINCASGKALFPLSFSPALSQSGPGFTLRQLEAISGALCNAMQRCVCARVGVRERKRAHVRARE